VVPNIVTESLVIYQIFNYIRVRPTSATTIVAREKCILHHASRAVMPPGGILFSCGVWAGAREDFAAAGFQRRLFAVKIKHSRAYAAPASLILGNPAGDNYSEGEYS